MSPPIPLDLQSALVALFGPIIGPIVREAVRAELAAAPSADELVDVATLPLTKRTAYELARDGKIVGARKVGKRWLAPRSSLAAIGSEAPRSAPRVLSKSHEAWTPAAALRRAGSRSSR